MKDAIRLEAPAAKTELELLKDIKVGEKRQSPLFPALEVDIEWFCTKAEADYWEFEARFLKQLVYRVAITVEADMLVLKEL